MHYGLDYLPWAIRSVYDHVDVFHCVYSPHPSHGSKTNLPPPETREQLMAAALDVGPKVQWHDVDRFWTEGPHRDYALSLCRGDLALVVDADEVWDGAVLEAALKHAYDKADARTWLINFTTRWRSMAYCCTDNMWPVRIHDLRQPLGAGPGYIPKEYGEIHHFGYAVRERIMRYKIATHGHHSEWREDWYNTKWSVWPPVPDCHPT
ncbi:MAG TPA: hypothetical protein VM537_33380, partial [Anaerolineae bacterium]|nr:hypothetical protein [Anaerolineae bacterium]